MTWPRGRSNQGLGVTLACKRQKAFSTSCGSNGFNKTLVRLGHRVFLTYTVAMTHIRVRLLLGTDLTHQLTVGVQADMTVTTGFLRWRLKNASTDFAWILHCKDVRACSTAIRRD
jgi:hypothetical protein